MSKPLVYKMKLQRNQWKRKLFIKRGTRRAINNLTKEQLFRNALDTIRLHNKLATETCNNINRLDDRTRPRHWVQPEY